MGKIILSCHFLLFAPLLSTYSFGYLFEHDESKIYQYSIKRVGIQSSSSSRKVASQEVLCQFLCRDKDIKQCDLDGRYVEVGPTTFSSAYPRAYYDALVTNSAHDSLHINSSDLSSVRSLEEVFEKEGRGALSASLGGVKEVCQSENPQMRTQDIPSQRDFFPLPDDESAVFSDGFMPAIVYLAKEDSNAMVGGYFDQTNLEFREVARGRVVIPHPFSGGFAIVEVYGKDASHEQYFINSALEKVGIIDEQVNIRGGLNRDAILSLERKVKVQTVISTSRPSPDLHEKQYLPVADFNYLDNGAGIAGIKSVKLSSGNVEMKSIFVRPDGSEIELPYPVDQSGLSEGLIPTAHSAVTGYLDTKGRLAFELGLPEGSHSAKLGPFHQGIALVTYRDAGGPFKGDVFFTRFIDRKGKWIGEPHQLPNISLFDDNSALAVDSKSGEQLIVSLHDNQVELSPLEYPYVTRLPQTNTSFYREEGSIGFANGLVRLYRLSPKFANPRIVGYMNSSGHLQIEAAKDWTLFRPYQENLAPVRVANLTRTVAKWGFLNIEGLFEHKAIYDLVAPFLDGKALVTRFVNNRREYSVLSRLGVERKLTLPNDLIESGYSP